jgi:NDP-sugar pyrophosphorylase family protein
MIEAAMVLAAGRGERMRPLSDALPKPALPLVEEPVIASPLRLAANAGANRVVVNTWHLNDEMEAALAETEPGCAVVVSREHELMGTAGGLALARDRGLLGTSGPVLVVNGDGLLNLDLAPVFERLADDDLEVVLALLPHLDPCRWSRVLLDADNLVTRIEPPGRPSDDEVPFVYPGVMLISRRALDSIEPGPGEVPARLWQPALARRGLGGVVVSGHWREIGTPAAYLEAVLTWLRDDRIVHPSATVHPTASVAAAVVGRDAVVEAGAEVSSAVVAHGARVRRGARVVRSVLLGAVAASPKEVVEDEVRSARRDRSHRRSAG